MATSISTFLIDDEISALENLEQLLAGYAFIKILGRITESSGAVETIIQHRPDLLFLDIQMPGKSGFEIVSELTQKGYRPAIIFVTAFDHFAIDAIRLAAFDFLVKPIDPQELKQSLERLMNEKRERNRDEQLKLLLERTITKQKIKVSTAGGFTMIDPDEIVYVNADWNYAEIFISNGKSEMVTINLGSLEELLPVHNFFRISRSVIINTSFLTKVSRTKRLAYLQKAGMEYTFNIPLLNIRKLEKFLEK
jgi:two-component system LytT family response regulator